MIRSSFLLNSCRRSETPFSPILTHAKSQRRYRPLVFCTKIVIWLGTGLSCSGDP
jgi:hypothetical protein